MKNATLVANTSQNARSSESPSKEQMASRFHSQTNILHTSTIEADESPTAHSSQHSTAHGPSNETSAHNEFTKRSDETASNILPVQANPADIICGRGLHIMNRHGNLNFHLLVNRYRQTYLTSTRRDKAAITRHIVQEIKSTGARFLRRFDEDNQRVDDDRWAEVDDKAAYKKVSHALRLRKSEHGRNFLKSVKIQEKMNSNVPMTAQAVAPTPLEVAVASSVQQNHPGNGPSRLRSSSLDMMGRPSCPPPEIQYQPVAVHTPPQLDYALAQQQMGLPISCPPPGIQYQPVAIHHAPPQLDHARSQPQTQPLQVLPWHYANGYGNVMLDPRLVANAFALTLATMTQAAHQHRSTVDGSMGSSQVSSLSRDMEERRR